MVPVLEATGILPLYQAASSRDKYCTFSNNAVYCYLGRPADCKISVKKQSPLKNNMGFSVTLRGLYKVHSALLSN